MGSSIPGWKVKTEVYVVREFSGCALVSVLVKVPSCFRSEGGKNLKVRLCLVTPHRKLSFVESPEE